MTAEINLPSDIGSENYPYFLVSVSVPIGASATLIAAKLELGTRSTLARLVNGEWVLNDPPPNFQQELAKCQRYQLENNVVGAARRKFGTAVAISNTSARVIIPTPVTMRLSPTVTYTENGFALWDGNRYYNLTGSIIGEVTAGNVTLTVNVESGLTPGNAYILTGTAGYNPSLLFDANL